MILNAKNNNFDIKLPKNFIYDDIRVKYERYIEHSPNPYNSLIDYINASIQGISFTGFSYEPPQQTLSDEFVKWKSGFDSVKMLDKRFTISFKTYEGFINYWIMREQLVQFLDFKTKNEFLETISLSFLDHEGFELVRYQFEQILMTSIGDLELSYSDNNPSFGTFAVDFTYNYLKIKHTSD